MQLKSIFKNSYFKYDVLVVLLVFGSVWYLFTNYLLLLAFFILLVLLGIFFLFYRQSRFKLKLSLFSILLVGLVVITLFVNFYTFYFYVYLFKTSYTLNTFFEINQNLFILLVKYLVLFATYSYTSYTLGDSVLKKLYRKKANLFHYYEEVFVSVVLGLSIHVLFLFGLGSFGLISGISLLTYAGLLLAAFHKRMLNDAQVLYKIFFIKKLYFGASSFIESFVQILFFVFFCSTGAVTFRSFTFGPDAWRAYLLNIKELATTGSLLATANIVSSPYPVELLFAPAFLLGGIPLTISLVYTFSLLFLIGFALCFRTSAKEKSFLPLVLLLASTPLIINFLAIQFKTDLFLLLVASVVLLLTLKYLKTLNFELAVLIFYFMGFALLIKATSLFFVCPVSLVLLFLYFKHSKLPKLRIIKQLLAFCLASLVSLILWIFLYKVNLKYIGDIGMGLIPLNVIATDTKKLGQAGECSLYDYEMDTLYQFNHTFTSYKEIPTYILNGTDAGPFFDLSEYGVPVFFLLLFSLIFFRKMLIEHGKGRLNLLFGSVLLGYIGFLLVVPIYGWYGLPVLFILLTLITQRILELSEKHTLTFKYFLYFFSSLYMTAAFGFIYPEHYFPLQKTVAKDYLNFASKNSPGADVGYIHYKDATDLAEFLNENSFSTDKFLFTYSVTFINFNYYIDNYFEKAIFLEPTVAMPSQNDFLNYIRTTNIKYFVYNKLIDNIELTCSKNSAIQYHNYFSEFGELVYKNSTYEVYKKIN
ncbi:MAG: hypothetical protein ACOZAO_03940 [Patescibacteria group bacterium]